MDKIKFCYISPVQFIEQVTDYSKSTTHLALAHLIDETRSPLTEEQRVKYIELYRNYSNQGHEIILDNSAFELSKEDPVEYYTVDQLIEIAKQINAHYIVCTDYPYEESEKTLISVGEQSALIKAAGFKSFGVPQSLAGAFDSYYQSLVDMVELIGVDLVGISIIGAPNAFNFGDEITPELQGTNNMLSRRTIFDRLKREKIYDSRYNKKFHILGMGDGPFEISLLQQFTSYINSWDTSSPVWAGINNVLYDYKYPTYLKYGKVKTDVEFGLEIDEFPTIVNIKKNIDIIEELL